MVAAGPVHLGVGGGDLGKILSLRPSPYLGMNVVIAALTR